MLKAMKHKVLRNFMKKNAFEVKRINDLISKPRTKGERANVIILAMGPDALPHSGKIINPERFFPVFCNALAQCKILSVYVHGLDNFEREMAKRTSTPTILINLVHELYDNLGNYQIPDHLHSRMSAIFNCSRTAHIIKNKEKTNSVLSKQGIPMPQLNPKSGKIFSNAREGTHEKVSVFGASEILDRSRYNTKFIDTQIEYGSKAYFTCIRLVCVGSIVSQIYVRASDIENGNPSVHNADTPLDSELLDHIYDRLVTPNFQKFQSLAEKIESVLGPGFYVHDILVEKNSGNLYLSEVGFKFYDQSYSGPMMGVTEHRNFVTGVMDIESYAAYAASVFITYCAAKGFI